MGRLLNRVAFITGAARGLGRAIAASMAAEGADIALFDLCEDLPHRRLATREDLKRTEAALQEAGARVVSCVGDVRNFSDLQHAITETVSMLGGLDIVVANAGFGAPKLPFWELSEDAWDSVIDVNLKGCWLTCRAAAPALIERSKGTIVLISSNHGLKGAPGAAAYVSAKHGIVGLCKTMAIDLAPHNVTVNAVCPGSIDTEGNREGAAIAGRPFEDWVEQFVSKQLIKVIQRPEEVARVVTWLASDEARFITGHALPVDGGGTATVD